MRQLEKLVVALTNYLDLKFQHQMMEIREEIEKLRQEIKNQ